MIEWQRSSNRNATAVSNQLFNYRHFVKLQGDYKNVRYILKLEQKVESVLKRWCGPEDDSNLHKKYLLPFGHLLNMDAAMTKEPM